MTIKLPQLNKSLSCDKGENLFQALRSQEIAVASSCQGDGVCGKCVVTVKKGMENLSPRTELEEKLIEKYNYKKNQRISCQCELIPDEQGDIEITTSYW